MERLQASLQRKAGQEAKMLAAAAETQARKQEARATLSGLQPKVRHGNHGDREGPADGVPGNADPMLLQELSGSCMNV